MSNLELLRRDLSEVGILLDTEKYSNFYTLMNNHTDDVLIPQLNSRFSEIDIEDLLPLNLNAYDFLKLLNILNKYLLD